MAFLLWSPRRLSILFFSGISYRELLEELQARGFDLRGACHVEIRVVRSAVKL